MSFKKFCPKCGEEADSFTGNICTECFLKEKDFFTVDKISIIICKHCQKFLLHGKWIAFSEEQIVEEVVSKVKIIDKLEESKVFVELKKYSEVDYEAKVRVTGILSGKIVEKEKSVKFQLKDTVCDPCMKLRSDYREAVLQLRSASKESAKEMCDLAMNFLEKERQKDSLSDTSKVMELRTGFDLWIGSKKAAAKISRQLSKVFEVTPKVSRKLIGQENGKRKYRTTFCIKK
jgi:nonsense-mediated mRNA decay protein 3